MKPNPSPFDQAYIRWLAKFAPFEARCFEALCEFVRAQLDELLDRYYREGHESLNDFSAWAFERYIRDFEQNRAGEEGAVTETSMHVLTDRTARCTVPALATDSTGLLTVRSPPGPPRARAH